MRVGPTLALATLAAAPVAHADVELRLAPSVRAGVGGYSDLFLGAGVGPGVEAVMAPSVVADASFLPRVKLRAEYDFAFAYTQVNAGSSYDHFGELTLRLRPWGNLWLEIAGTGATQRFTVVGAPSSLGGAPEGLPGRLVTAYDTLSMSPRLRYRGDHLDAWIAYVVASTQSQDYIEESFTPTFACAPPFSGQADEVAQRAVASLSWSPVAWLAGSVQYRFTSNDANVGELVYDSHEGAAVVTAHLWRGWLRLEGGLQRTVFAVDRRDPVNACAPYQRRDLLLRGSVGWSMEIRRGVSLELAYGYARNYSTEKSDPTVNAFRHMVYLGIRVELGPWRY